MMGKSGSSLCRECYINCLYLTFLQSIDFKFEYSVIDRSEIHMQNFPARVRNKVCAFCEVWNSHLSHTRTCDHLESKVMCILIPI